MPQSLTIEDYRLPWYDSLWLSCYYQARDIVEACYPTRLPEFVQAFDILRTAPDYQIQDAAHLIAPETLHRLKTIIAELPAEKLEKHEFVSFGRLVVHNHPFSDQLQVELTEQVSQLVGQPLEPSYNFLAMYNNLGYCRPHMDAPNAKWTLDICIEQSQQWPIFFSQVQGWPEDLSVAEDSQWQQSIIEDPKNQFSEYQMKEGDALLFSGSSQWHYRPRIKQLNKQNFCHLLFLHYIPEGTSELVNPNLWTKLFAMPELQQVYFPRDDQ